MVANIVGNGRGTGPGGVGVAGVAPDATVRTYAVDSGAEDGTQCAANDFRAAIADAIGAATDDGSDILSISLSTHVADLHEKAAIERALAAGIVVVASSGQRDKDPAVTFPAAYPGVVAVSAVDRNAKPWSKNVVGNRAAVTISAPGVDVTTAAFIGKKWSSTVAASGTSGSTSLVAGSLAVVAAKYPKATGNQLIANMIHNPGGTQNFGHTPDFGYGIISLPNMLASDPTQWPDTNPLMQPGTDLATSTPAPTAEDATASTAQTEDDGGGLPVWIPIAAVVAIAAIAGGVLVRRTRLRS
jgi:subtilisin family serine protease